MLLNTKLHDQKTSCSYYLKFSRVMQVGMENYCKPSLQTNEYKTTLFVCYETTGSN